MIHIKQNFCVRQQYLKPFNWVQTNELYPLQNKVIHKLFAYKSHTHTHTHTHTHIYIYICVCVYVCKQDLAFNTHQGLKSLTFYWRPIFLTNRFHLRSNRFYSIPQNSSWLTNNTIWPIIHTYMYLTYLKKSLSVIIRDWYRYLSKFQSSRSINR